MPKPSCSLLVEGGDGLLVEVVAVLVGDEDGVRLGEFLRVVRGLAQAAHRVDMDRGALVGEGEGAVLEQGDGHGAEVLREEYLHLIGLGGLAGLFPGLDAALEVIDLVAGVRELRRGLGAPLAGPAVDGEGDLLRVLRLDGFQETFGLPVAVGGVAQVSGGIFFRGADVHDGGGAVVGGLLEIIDGQVRVVAGAGGDADQGKQGEENGFHIGILFIVDKYNN